MDKEYLSKRETIYIMENEIIEYKIGLIKQIDSLQRDNLVWT